MSAWLTPDELTDSAHSNTVAPPQSHRATKWP